MRRLGLPRCLEGVTFRRKWTERGKTEFAGQEKEVLTTAMRV
jgi:hypothetical protein